MTSFCDTCGYMQHACICVEQILHQDGSPNRRGCRPNHIHSFDLAKQQTHCHGCYEFILKGCVRIEHRLYEDGHRRSLYYHVPCWLANSKDRPKFKRLSHYRGFFRLDLALQQKVKQATRASLKDIRLDSSSPPPMSKPKPPPKQCLAIKMDGTRCKVRTNSTQSKAASASLVEDGQWTCLYHEDYMVPPLEVEEEEAKYQQAMETQKKQYEMVMEQKRLHKEKHKAEQTGSSKKRQRVSMMTCT